MLWQGLGCRDQTTAYYSMRALKMNLWCSFDGAAASWWIVIHCPQSESATAMMRHLSMASQLAANVSYERKSGASQYLIAIASWLSNGFEDYAYCFYPKGFIYGVFEDEK